MHFLIGDPSNFSFICLKFKIKHIFSTFIYKYYRMCVLGKRLLKDIHIENCTKIPGGELHQTFCPNNTCDPYFVAHEVSVVQGIKVRYNLN